LEDKTAWDVITFEDEANVPENLRGQLALQLS
jgi:hypothetical protein